MNPRIRRFLIVACVTASVRSYSVPTTHAEHEAIPPSVVMTSHSVTVPTPQAEEGAVGSEPESEPPSSPPVLHSSAVYNPQNEALMQELAASIYGWTGSQWQDLRTLMMGESGFDDRVANASSGAAGIGQNINGLAGYPDPSAKGQILWTLAYIQRRYTNPSNALYFWQYIAPTKPPYNGHWY